MRVTAARLAIVCLLVSLALPAAAESRAARHRPQPAQALTLLNQRPPVFAGIDWRAQRYPEPSPPPLLHHLPLHPFPRYLRVGRRQVAVVGYYLTGFASVMPAAVAIFGRGRGHQAKLLETLIDSYGMRQPRDVRVAMPERRLRPTPSNPLFLGPRITGGVVGRWFGVSGPTLWVCVSALAGGAKVLAYDKSRFYAVAYRWAGAGFREVAQVASRSERKVMSRCG